MINLHEVWDRAGIELATPGIAVRHASVARHVTDCATRPVTVSTDQCVYFSMCFSGPVKLKVTVSTDLCVYFTMFCFRPPVRLKVTVSTDLCVYFSMFCFGTSEAKGHRIYVSVCML